MCVCVCMCVSSTMLSLGLCHDSFVCVTWLIHIFDITGPYATCFQASCGCGHEDMRVCVCVCGYGRDSICVTCMTHSYEGRDSFI